MDPSRHLHPCLYARASHTARARAHGLVPKLEYLRARARARACVRSGSMRASAHEDACRVHARI
eukprot:6190867-Pleurochrysis_carterae.AAC.2